LKKPTLPEVFDKYNQKYFRGKLKISGIRFGKVGGRSAAETTFFSDCAPIITINRGLITRGRFCRIAVLHEMAHVSLPDAVAVNHGPEFKKVIRRLVSRGAYDDLL
jgi:hypothetical protein